MALQPNRIEQEQRFIFYPTQGLVAQSLFIVGGTAVWDGGLENVKDDAVIEAATLDKDTNTDELHLAAVISISRRL